MMMPHTEVLLSRSFIAVLCNYVRAWLVELFFLNQTAYL